MKSWRQPNDGLRGLGQRVHAVVVELQVNVGFDEVLPHGFLKAQTCAEGGFTRVHGVGQHPKREIQVVIEGRAVFVMAFEMHLPLQALPRDRGSLGGREECVGEKRVQAIHQDAIVGPPDLCVHLF